MLFAKRNKPKSRYPIAWGFMCHDGWFDLIDTLCAEIQAAVDAGRVKQPVVLQVKEKFGALRFYVAPSQEEVTSMIDRAEERSSVTCDMCGQPGVLRSTKHYLRTTCLAHADPDSHVVTQEPDQGVQHE